MTIVFCDRVTAFGDVAWLTGPGADPHLPDGIHWHVTMGPSGGLPAGPTVLVDLLTNVDSFRGVGPVMSFGQRGANGWQIDADRGEDLTLVFEKPGPGPEVLGWALVQGDGDLTLSAADPRLTRQGLWSTNAARAQPLPDDPAHWRLASADCEVVRVTGRGTVIEASASVGIGRFGLDHGRVLARASLAAEEAARIPFYLPARDDSDDWETRVQLSAPTYRLPSDRERPGLFEPDPAREIARIRAIVDPRRSSGGVDGVGAWCERAYQALDSGRRGRVDGTAGSTTMSQHADDAYLQASIDPGVARWQGLSGTLDREPDPNDTRVVGLAAALVPVFRLRSPYEQPAQQELDETERFYEEEINGYGDLRAATRAFARLEDGSWWDLNMIVVPLPYVRECPADGPEQPALQALGSSWNAVTIDTWTATVGIDRVVPRGELAFVQTAPTATTLHSGPAGAPNPMIAGFSTPKGRHVVSALGVSGGLASIDVAVCLEDWLGRWGEPGASTLLRPDRPPAPLPSGQAFVSPTATRVGDAAASTASVRLDVTVQWPVGPGSVPLTELRISIPRESSPRVLHISAADITAGIVSRVVEFAAGETTPGQTLDEVATVECVDTEGRISGSALVTARIVDPRPIRPPVAGPRLIASTRRGNSPTVTVTLAIAAAENARAYRVLIAGETTLRSAFGLPTVDAAEPRAERAAAVRRAMPAHDNRSLYSWASTSTYPVQGDTAYATIELPAGIDGVVFARAVAVTIIPGNPPTESVSTPFERTTPVAIVVPKSDFPPVPDVRVSVADDGTANVTVRVTRPPSSVLPSLQIVGTAPTNIEARIIEYLDGDPAFWPQVATVTLQPSPADPTVHEGTTKLRGQAWTRTAVAACVRYPPEPTLAAGATATSSEIQATGLQHEQIPSPWGPFSAPAWIDTTGVLPTLEFVHAGGAIAITAAGLPTLPPASPAWTMQLLSGEVSLSPSPGPLGVPVLASAGLIVSPVLNHAYAVVLRDPFGVEWAPVPVPVH